MKISILTQAHRMIDRLAIIALLCF